MGPGAIGPGLGGTNLSGITGGVPLAALAALPAAVGRSGALGDSVSTLLDDLSAADIGRLMDLIERPLPAEATAQLQNLLQTFLSAAAEGDAIRALSALSEIAALDPSRPDVLRTDPAIAPIRASVDQFLDRQTTVARLDAEGRLEQTASGADRLAGWDMPPATMVLIANRVFDSGGLANYMRAADLAQLAIDGSRWAPAFVSVPADAPKPVRINSLGGPKRPGGMPLQGIRQATEGIGARLRYLWRAPLLILLVAWLLLGIAGGFGSMLWHRFRLETWPSFLAAIAFQIWGIGFLGLVVLGFYAHVRKVRF